MQLSDKMIERLTKLAKQGCWFDSNDEDDGDTTVDDYAGGNVDDAYEGGVRNGETELSREILTDLGIEY